MLPSPIGRSNSEAGDDFTNLIDKKAKPHEESNSNNNITFEYPDCIHRSVTDDNNVAAPPPPIGVNADFSSAILLGSSSAHAAPTSSYCAPNAMTSQMQTYGRAAAAATSATAASAGVPLQQTQTLFSGPTPLMSTTLDTTMVAATGKQNVAPVYVEKWTCDVCKRRTFDTFEDANQHEISCKILHDAKKKMAQEGSVYPWEDPTKQQRKKEVAPPKQKRRKKKAATQDQAPPSMMQMALPSAPMAAPPHGRHPSLSLIPSANRSNVLSEYNNMLVRNIEFFYPASSHLDYDNLSGSMNSSLMSQNRLGLRCIHCKDSPTHVTAAAFFPRTIGSIASGLGTVGTRHFGWGKCKSL